jgi:hypothetical protein
MHKPSKSLVRGALLASFVALVLVSLPALATGAGAGTGASGSAPTAEAPPPGTEAPTIAATCGKRANSDFLIYMSHVAPNSGSVSPQPNGCWGWSDFRGVNQPGTYICTASGATYGSPGNATKIYDDTNQQARTVAQDNTNISNCLAPSGSHTLNYEYMAARSTSGCAAAWRKTAPSGVSVLLYQAETYCTDTTRDSFAGSYTPSSNTGGVVNVGPDVSNRTNLIADINGVCNRTATGQTMTIYANTPISATVQGWINDALNNCIF